MMIGGMSNRLKYVLLFLALLMPLALFAEGFEARISVIRVDEARDLPLSRLDIPPDDDGLAGARLGLADNETTGSFLGIKFQLDEFSGDEAAALAHMGAQYESGARVFILNAGTGFITKAADLHQGALLLNASAPENALRNADCRAGLLHIAPSNKMLADALAQYLIHKKWDKWFLIHGSHEADRELADSYRGAAQKFGAKIVEEREYVDREGARRTDSGHVLVQREMPVFTQSAPEHDVVIAADASEVFGAYLPYRIWDARPVAGSSGLRPTAWEPSHEAWGATQFQRRFEKATTRYARPLDYQNWLAMRVLGEAVVRIASAEPGKLRDYLLSEEFEIAGFKGTKLDFRPWNGQLRQPILLSDGRLMVSVSPQEGFLHQTSELDTLGFDKEESECDVGN